jgi:hypothetical protein
MNFIFALALSILFLLGILFAGVTINFIVETLFDCYK